MAEPAVGTGAGGLGRHRLVPLTGMRTLCHEVTRGGGLSATHWMRFAVGRVEALTERKWGKGWEVVNVQPQGLSPGQRVHIQLVLGKAG